MLPPTTYAANLKNSPPYTGTGPRVRSGLEIVVEDRFAIANVAIHELTRFGADGRELSAEAGRNIYFTQLFNRLLDEGRRLLRLYYRSFEDRLPQRYVEEHEALIAVIEAGDANAADRISRAHAEQIVAQISRFFASETRPEIDLS